jgi:TonB-dependent receptor
MVPENLGGERLQIQDESTNLNNYKADNILGAAYLSAEVPIGGFNLNAGLRYEHHYTEMTEFTQVSGDKKDLADYAYDNLFPSLNATYNLSSRALLRMAYGMSVNRPELRELSPSVYYDFEMFSEVIGNTDLKQATVQNFDIRYEYYPSAGELVTVALFYKNFRNPIEWTYFDTGGGYRYSFTNARSADSYGVELDVRKSLEFVGLPGLTLTMNASLINSRVRFDEQSVDHDRPMQGQSPWLVNGGVFWQNKSGSLALGALYNRIGKRIVGLGRVESSGGDSFSNTIPDLYEMPRHAIDFTFSARLTKNLELRGAIKDILCEDVLFAQYPRHLDESTGKLLEREQVTKAYNPGRNISLTLSATF